MHTIVDFLCIEGNNCTHRHEDTHTCSGMGKKNEQFRIRYTSYPLFFFSCPKDSTRTTEISCGSKEKSLHDSHEVWYPEVNPNRAEDTC